jgi:hypothetical protein
MAEGGAGWDSKPFNEDNPFGKKSTVVGGDNILHSKQRWEAIKAVKENRATPAQQQLVHDADIWMQNALAQREE